MLTGDEQADRRQGQRGQVAGSRGGRVEHAPVQLPERRQRQAQGGARIRGAVRRATAAAEHLQHLGGGAAAVRKEVHLVAQAADRVHEAAAQGGIPGEQRARSLLGVAGVVQGELRARRHPLAPGRGEAHAGHPEGAEDAGLAPARAIEQIVDAGEVAAPVAQVGRQHPLARHARGGHLGQLAGRRPQRPLPEPPHAVQVTLALAGGGVAQLVEQPPQPPAPAVAAGDGKATFHRARFEPEVVDGQHRQGPPERRPVAVGRDGLPAALGQTGRLPGRLQRGLRLRIEPMVEPLGRLGREARQAGRTGHLPRRQAIDRRAQRRVQGGHPLGLLEGDPARDLVGVVLQHGGDRPGILGAEGDGGHRPHARRRLPGRVDQLPQLLDLAQRAQRGGDLHAHVFARLAGDRGRQRRRRLPRAGARQPPRRRRAHEQVVRVGARLQARRQEGRAVGAHRRDQQVDGRDLGPDRRLDRRDQRLGGGDRGKARRAPGPGARREHLEAGAREQPARLLRQPFGQRDQRRRAPRLRGALEGVGGQERHQRLGLQAPEVAQRAFLQGLGPQPPRGDGAGRAAGRRRADHQLVQGRHRRRAIARGRLPAGRERLGQGGLQAISLLPGGRHHLLQRAPLGQPRRHRLGRPPAGRSLEGRQQRQQRRGVERVHGLPTTRPLRSRPGPRCG